VIITSRDKNFDVNLNSEPIDRLSDDETYQMFIKYLQKSYSKEQLEPLLRFTANTPLVIEVLAKQSKKMLKTRELNEVIEYFKDSNLNLKSKIPLSRDDVDSKDITEIINTIFKSNQIERQEQKEILTALANLSPEGVSLDNLIKWLDIEDEDELIETLEELESLGWLSEREEENKPIYQIHRIVKEVVNQNIKQPKTIDLLIDSLKKQLDIKTLNNNYLNGKIYLLDVKELIKNDLKTKEFATLLNNFSLTLYALGDLNEAKKYQLKTIEIEEKVLEPSHPSLATSYNNLSLILKDLGDFNEAKKYQLKAIEIQERVLEPSHPDLASSYNNLSTILKDLGNFNEAKKYQLKTIEIFEIVLESSHPHLAGSYNNLSMILSDLGDLNEAKKYQLKAIKIREKVFEPSHPSLITSYKNILIIYMKLKDTESIIKTVNILIERMDKKDEDYPSLLELKEMFDLIGSSLQS